MIRAFALGLAVAASGLLAGCGGRAASQAPGGANAPAAGDSAGPGAAPSPAAATKTPVAIKINSRHAGSRYVTLTKQKENRKVYTLLADSETGQYVGADTGTSTFANPHVTFYGKNGQTLAAVAPTGTIVEKDKTILMSGGVKAHTSDGKTLASDTMRYADVTETLYGDGNVVITTPAGDRLQGDTLVWNLHTGRIDVGRAL